MYAAARGITDRKLAEGHLVRHMEELARFNRLRGREHRMMELKRQGNPLLQKAGKPPAYDLSFALKSERNLSAPRTAEAG